MSDSAPGAPAVLFLAAGRSSRFGRPKQTAPLGPTGGSLLAYSVVDALRAGFGQVVLVTTPEMEPALREHLAEVVDPGLPLRFVHQRVEDLPSAFAHAAAGREKPWGTAHAVLCAEEALGEHPFAVANADDWYGPEAWRSLVRGLGATTNGVGAPGEVLAVGYPVRETLSPRGGVSRGWMEVDAAGYASTVLELTRLSDEEGRIRGQDPGGEEVEIPGDAQVSMNLWGFPPGFVSLLRRAFLEFMEVSSRDPNAEFALSTAVDRFLAEGTLRLRVLEGGDEWFGVTHPGDAAEVGRRLEALHAEGTYSTPLSASLA